LPACPRHITPIKGQPLGWGCSPPHPSGRSPRSHAILDRFVQAHAFRKLRRGFLPFTVSVRQVRRSSTREQSELHAAYAADIAVACLLTYFAMTWILPRILDWKSNPVGVIWAVISTVFVLGILAFIV
jgi:hypothetical protein